MKTRLKLFFKWGIQFEKAYSIEEKSEREVQYADSKEIEAAVLEKYPPKPEPIEFAGDFRNNSEKAVKKQVLKTSRKEITNYKRE